MSLRNLSDDQLHLSTVDTARRERAVSLELLVHLNEVERRHLFSNFNCSSLHGYCVQELKMTSGNACHHMDAARLLREVPAIQEKVLNGAIAVTTVADAQAFFKREARAGRRFDSAAKADVLAQLEDKSTREADKILLSNSVNSDVHLKESVKQKSETLVEVKLYFDEETMTALERLREIWSHAMPHAKLSDVIKRAANEAVEKNVPLKKIERSEVRAAKKSTIAARPSEKRVALETKSAPLPKSETPALGLKKGAIRRAIWKRDQAQCTFVDPRTGEQCEARHFVEEDHIVPKAVGGGYSIPNMRLRCRAHNQRHAINCFGAKKMSDYLSAIRDEKRA